jgi:hypothetical protein
MSNVDFLELSQEEEMEFVTQVKKLEDTNNLLSSSLDDLTISQIAENMENEHFVFQEMEDLSISQTSQCVTRNSI